MYKENWSNNEKSDDKRHPYFEANNNKIMEVNASGGGIVITRKTEVSSSEQE